MILFLPNKTYNNKTFLYCGEIGQIVGKIR